MPRTTLSDRVVKLLDAAAAAFVEHGFQRTQMDDIAERLGVSKGTIYRAVDSKDALFAAVIAWGDTPDPPLDGGAIVTGHIGEVGARVAGELADAVAALELTTIVAGRRRLRNSHEVGDEIEQVTIGLHRMMRRRRTAIMVLDRCAAELPELTDVWFGDGRYALVDLWHDYLQLRAAHLANDIDPTVLARTVVEIITTWAVKIPWDPAPRPYPDDTAPACAAMIRNLAGAPR